MFKYNTEVIINSLKVSTDSYGTGATSDKLQPSEGILNVLRTGTYKYENIVDGRIYKTAGIPGANGSITLKVDNSLFDAGIYRLTIPVKLNDQYLGEFANSNWYRFGRSVNCEFEVKSSTEAPATIAARIAEGLKLAVPYNNKFAVTTIVTSTSVKFTLTNPYMSVDQILLEKYEVIGNDYAGADYKEVVIPAANLTVVGNVEPFATSDWMKSNLRYPTYYNLRDAALNGEEFPVPGGIYTQYTFGYKVARPELGGVSSVGQVVESSTLIVFYVLDSLVTDFEAAIEEAFGANSIVTNKSVTIVGAPIIANDGIPVRLQANVYPENSSVSYTFALVGTPVGVTITENGVLTASSSATIGETFGVKLTLNGDSGYTTEEVEFTVVKG